MAAPDGGGGPHAFVTDLERPELSAHDRHHLERVLRVAVGDPLTVSDGRGAWRACRFGGRVLELAGPIEHVPPARPALTIGFALVKGERPEWVTQKLTELGVDRIVPFAAARSVVRWDAARASRNRDRLATVAREAAMQSRQCWLPDVEPITTFGALASRPGAAMADRTGGPPTLDLPVVLVGPEGGWSDAEREQALPLVALSDAVLRADTAAVVAGALLTALRDGLVGPLAR